MPQTHNGLPRRPWNVKRWIRNEKRPSMIVGNRTIALVTWTFKSRTRTSAEDHQRPSWRISSPETLVLYRKRASTKEVYLNTVVRRAFDKAV
jgi:hypothetical protein